jgi:hypothetical protein
MTLLDTTRHGTLLDAVDTANLTGWMDATRSNADVVGLRADIARALPHLAPTALAAVVEHPACAPLAAPNTPAVPFLADALARGHRGWLETLCATRWFEATPFVELVRQTLDAGARNPADASTALAMAADKTIAKRHWSDYADGLVLALAKGHIGALSWAVQVDLPVDDCLPLREGLSRLHGSGVDEAVFRLAVLGANARTNHQKLRLRKVLEQAEPTPEGALFGANTKLWQAALALPTVAPTTASIAAR